MALFNSTHPMRRRPFIKLAGGPCHVNSHNNAIRKGGADRGPKIKILSRHGDARSLYPWMLFVVRRRYFGGRTDVVGSPAGGGVRLRGPRRNLAAGRGVGPRNWCRVAAAAAAKSSIDFQEQIYNVKKYRQQLKSGRIHQITSLTHWINLKPI